MLQYSYLSLYTIELSSRARANTDESLTSAYPFLHVRNTKKEYNKTEDDLKALQSVGQIISDVLKQLDDERFIVKASSGPRYVVGCRKKLEKV